MSDPLISIITVVYNGAATLERTIRSVAAQTYKNIEYIIVDGGSKDGTLEIVKNNQDKISRWISEPDHGLYDAMNKGIRLAQGSVIGLVNSDDWLEPDAVEKVVSCIPEHEDLFVIHGDICYWNGFEKKIYHTQEDIKPVGYYFRIAHPTCFVAAEVYKKVGVFSDEYKIASDADFLLRAVHYPVHFIHAGSVISNMQTGGESQKHFFKTQREAIQIRHKWGVPLWKLYLNASKLFLIMFLSSLRRRH